MDSFAVFGLFKIESITICFILRFLLFFYPPQNDVLNNRNAFHNSHEICELCKYFIGSLVVCGLSGILCDLISIVLNFFVILSSPSKEHCSLSREVTNN